MTVAGILNAVMLKLASNDHLRFTGELYKAALVQEDILQRIVGGNARSEFGQEHSFASICGSDDFRRKVPVREYEDFRPYVERISSPDSGVLTEEPTLLFEPTSGSSGPTKFIPYTRGLQREFHRAINPWMVDIYRRRPSLARGRAYWSISPPVTRAAAPATTVPVGFESDSSYLSRLSGMLVQRTFVTSRALKSETDPDVFFRELSLSLLTASDLALVSIWSPNAFLVLLDYIRHSRHELLESLRRQADGTRNPGSTRWSRTRRDALRRLLVEDPIPFADIWPNLKFLSCWADGPNRPYADRLAAIFPDCEIQGKGLVATEAITTIPFGGRCYVPAYRSHFFEFLPAGEDTESVLLHQLDDGQRYRLVLTTSGGLYRYLPGDIVEVAGRYQGVPLLHFVSRDRVLDHFGEKLHVDHVAEAVRGAAESLGEPPAFLLFGFESDGDAGFYCLYLEPGRRRTSGDGDLDAVRKRLAESLRANYHYAHAITLSQLFPLRLFLIDRDGAPTYVRRLNERGIRIGDIKTETVSDLTDWSAWFRGSFCRV